jgi:hypothetical protein
VWLIGLIAGTGAFIWVFAAVLFLRVPASTITHASDAQLAWRRAVLSAVTHLHKHPTAHVAKFVAKNGFWNVFYASLPPSKPIGHPKSKSRHAAPRIRRMRP